MKKIIKEITPVKKSNIKENAKKKVVAYARVSTEQDEQLHSLQVQRDYYEEYIKSNDRLFNLTILNIKVYKEKHLEFNFKDGSVINIEL